jgi:LDH2 family malate/lactate/ureidoglycolate dehydrogenase
MNISIIQYRESVMNILQKQFSETEASVVAEYLLWADMSGIQTQGVIKMTGTGPLQDITPEGEVEVVRDTPVSAVIDAHKHPAPYVASIATDKVLEKASISGIGIVGVRNTFSSNGAQAYYLDRIARAGYIGMMCSRSPAAQNAFGGIDPVFGTNPIGFAFPTSSDPVVFDMATSAMTWYGLVLAKSKGEQIPEGLAIDSSGISTTDPESAMNGALLPFGGYKSSCLAMMVELLTGPFIGSSYIDNKTFDKDWGTFILAIDPNILTDTDEFKKHASEMMMALRSARTREGEEVRIPGERARQVYQQSLESGMVDVEEGILRELNIIM